jgi:hypothetical protein
MRPELMFAVHDTEHGDIEHAPGLVGRAFAARYLARAIFGDKFLDRAIEPVSRRPLFFDVFGAKRLLAILEAFVERALVHRILPMFSRTSAHQATLLV